MSHSHGPGLRACPGPGALHTAPEAAECPTVDLSRRTVWWTHDASQLSGPGRGREMWHQGSSEMTSI